MSSELATVDPEDFTWPKEQLARLATLTEKQRRFVEEYLIDFNASAAVKRAGYNPKDLNSAAAMGSRLIRHPAVQPVLLEMANLSAEQLGISRAYILARLRHVAEKAIEGNPKFVGKDGALAVVDGEVVYEMDSGGANKALELLARLRGDMIERKEVNVKSVHLIINGIEQGDLT